MIICFSGNGNSRLVARETGVALGDKQILYINSDSRPLGQSDTGRIVWVLPVHSWGIPRMVRRYIATVPLGGGYEHHLVLTCGDDCGLAARQWAEDIRRRGWRPVTATSVQMPNTYVLLPGFDVDPVEVARAKIMATKEAMPRVAGVIEHGCEPWDRDVYRGSMAWLKTKVIYPLFMRFLSSPEPFGYEPARCDGCGACVGVCPCHNIRMENDHPVWGKECTLCLGCYNRCPHHAVKYGSVTKGKGQYPGPTRIMKQGKPGERE